MDVFKEQIIKRETSGKDRVMRVGLFLGVVVVFFGLLTFAVQFIPLTIAAAFGALWLSGRLNVEYEYSITLDTLDIDIIINQSKRKRLFSGSIKDFDSMGPHTNDKDQNTSRNESMVCDYSSGNIEARKYAFIAQHLGKRVRFVIEPNDILLDAFAIYVPQRKFTR